jgi:type VII secretion-associated serine protease mycosin
VRVVTVRSVGGRPEVDVATVDGRAAAADAVEQSQESADVVSVSLDGRAQATALRATDTYRGEQWALDRLKAEDTWSTGAGAGITVAVIDSGVAGKHPDLAGRVVQGIDYVTAGGNGTADGNGHGTHVAGIVGAVANNRAGIAGLAPGVKILPVRVLGNDGSGWNSDIAQGIVYAADHGAAVVNLSLGGSVASTALRDAVRYAVSRNVVVVAAAGNARADGSPTSYPAAFPDVIGVAATDSADHVATFSNAGSYVDVAAPGVRILATYPVDRYAYLSGTSMASPYVAAAAALVKAAKPALTPAQVASALQSTAGDLGPAGRDNDFGYGLVNPRAAVCTVVDCTVPAPSASPTPTPTPTPAPQRVATVTRLVSGSTKVPYGAWIDGTARVTDTRGAGLQVPVQVCVRVEPAKSYTCQVKAADDGGNVAYRVRATANTSLYAAHPGSGSTARSIAPAVRYTVVPRVSVRAGRNAVTGSVSTGVGQRVYLDRWNGRRWVVTRSVTVGRDGSVTFARLATSYYRLRVPATATSGGYTSGHVRVR